MNKQQLGMLLDLIDIAYPGKLKTDNPQILAETWFTMLEEYDYNYVSHNLRHHIKSSPYLPSISDLITDKKKQEGGRYIPDAAETKMMLENKYSSNVSGLLTNDFKVSRDEILAEKEKALKTIANAVKRSEEENPYKVVD